MVIKSMTILGEPKFADIPALHRHFYLGVNCYHFAANEKRIVVYTAPENPSHFCYLMVNPGTVAKTMQKLSYWTAPDNVYEQLLADACIDDGFIPLEDTTTSLAVNIPKGNRLVAMMIDAFGEGYTRDFHFHALNPHTALWEEKFVGQDIKTRRDLVPQPADRYRLARLFIAPAESRLKGIPDGGISVPLPDGYTLYFLKPPPPFQGKAQYQDNGNILRYNGFSYAKPAWPQMATAPA